MHASYVRTNVPTASARGHFPKAFSCLELTPTHIQPHGCIAMQVAPPDFDRVFAALADATRRDIVRRAIDGEEGVAELAKHYPMSFAAAQKHVAVLERAGLVTKQRTGRRKVVRTNVEGLRVARRLLDRYEQLWRDRIERMGDLISNTKETDA